jgi:hypothetical protein
LDISFVAGEPPRDPSAANARFLFDLAGLGAKLSAQSVSPAYRDSCNDFYWYAPGVTFSGFRTPRRNIRLAGNFDNARFVDSEMPMFKLELGSFFLLDLRRAHAERIWLFMDYIDVDYLRLPKGVEGVWFIWRVGRRRNSFATRGPLAGQVTRAWNCPVSCEALASQILKGSPRGANYQHALQSRGRTLRGVAGHGLGEWVDVAAACGLIARRNQLRAAGARGGASSTPPGPHGGLGAGGATVPR